MDLVKWDRARARRYGVREPIIVPWEDGEELLIPEDYSEEEVQATVSVFANIENKIEAVSAPKKANAFRRSIKEAKKKK